jgi:hypothetical protein
VGATTCSCRATPVADEDDALRAERVPATADWVVTLQPHAQPWFDVRAADVRFSLKPGTAYRSHCQPSQEPSCQDGEFFRAQLTATVDGDVELGHWDVSVTLGDGSSLAVSTRIDPPVAWSAKEPLPEKAQLHLAIASLHPLQGEIFVLTGGGQQEVVTFAEVNKP